MLKEKNRFLFLNLILILIILAISLLPFLVHSFQTPKGYTYLGTERFHNDYFGMLAMINRGGTTSFANFTQVLNGVHIEYLIIGKIGHLLSITSPIIIYHLSRFALFSLFLLGLYLFFKKTLKSQRAVFVAIISSFLIISPPLLQTDGEGFTLDKISFFALPSFAERLMPYQHHLIGSTLLLIIIYLIMKNHLLWNFKGFALTFLFILLMGYIHASQNLILLPGLFIFATLIIIKSIRNKTPKIPVINEAIIYFLFLLATVLPLFYLESSFQRSEANKLPLAQEIFFSTEDSKEPLLLMLYAYFSSVSLLIIPSFLYLKKNYQKDENLFFLSYALSGLFFFLFTFQILGASRVRLSQTAFFLPFAFLAASYFEQLLLTKKRGATILLIILLLISLPPNLVSLNRNLFNYSLKNLPEYSYIETGRFEAIQEAGKLLKNTSPEDTFLSHQDDGAIISAFTNRPTFIQDPLNSVDFIERRIKVIRLYNADLTVKDAREFLLVNNVRLIYLSDKEKEILENDVNLEKTYPFIKRVFKNNSTELFMVNF
jgi:hypothetical protein